MCAGGGSDFVPIGAVRFSCEPAPLGAVIWASANADSDIAAQNTPVDESRRRETDEIRVECMAGGPYEMMTKEQSACLGVFL
jgi:hypothetical protein